MGKLRRLGLKGKRWGNMGDKFKTKQRQINKMEGRLNRLGNRRTKKLIGRV